MKLLLSINIINNKMKLNQKIKAIMCRRDMNA